MKVGVLTSSRADFGIYQPLLKRLKVDAAIELTIIAFGAHLSPYHGNTIQEIKQEDFASVHTISSLLLNDDVESISTAYGLTVIKFSEYWRNHEYDIVLCLGDRYEMAAAVQAGIPFGVYFCHIHGGETTTGAIDNIYRHQITLASRLHFAATGDYVKRIESLIGSAENVYHTGSLSIDDILSLDLPDDKILRATYGIPEQPYILGTFHPETVHYTKNRDFAAQMYEALKSLAATFGVVITMPNADTQGSIYREKIKQLKQELPDNICIVEHFGKLNYFAAMKYAHLLVGNTSSGIIEAASFNKYVVNVGERQQGRTQSPNVFNVAFEASSIVRESLAAANLGEYHGENVYHKPGCAALMHQLIINQGE